MVSPITRNQPRFGIWGFNRRRTVRNGEAFDLNLFKQTNFKTALQDLGLKPGPVIKRYIEAFNANPTLGPEARRKILMDVAGLLQGGIRIKGEASYLVNQFIGHELPSVIERVVNIEDWRQKYGIVSMMPVSKNQKELNENLRTKILECLLFKEPLKVSLSPEEEIKEYEIFSLLITLPIKNKEWCGLLDPLRSSAPTKEEVLKIAVRESAKVDKNSGSEQHSWAKLLHRCLIEYQHVPYEHLPALAQQVEVEQLQNRFLLSVTSDNAQQNDKTLIAQLPALIYQLPHQVSHTYANRIEATMDSNSAIRGAHPHEAELMLFLRHPKNPKRDDVDAVTRALTSITRFIESKMDTVSDSIANHWGHIGVLSHQFLLWKYDAEKGLAGQPALLMQYGFHRIEQRFSDSQWGTGYVMTKAQNPLCPIDERTFIEFRRTYIVVTHPRYGTLLIRNSSLNPQSGRSMLKHAAYFSEEFIPPRDIIKFDPASDQRLKTILQTSYYSKNVSTIENRMAFLLGQLEEVKQDYQHWKFDTEFHNGQFRGHLSPGFKPIIQKWQAHAESDKPLAFAFVHPFYPPWNYYAYTSRLGRMATYTPSKAHQMEVEMYLSGQLPNKRESLSRTDWFNFLQAGINAHGELILVEDKIDRKGS